HPDPEEWDFNTCCPALDHEPEPVVVMAFELHLHVSDVGNMHVNSFQGEEPSSFAISQHEFTELAHRPSVLRYFLSGLDPGRTRPPSSVASAVKRLLALFQSIGDVLPMGPLRFFCTNIRRGTTLAMTLPSASTFSG